MERVRLRLYGSVQGVGFRFFAARQASRHGLVGYVRNLPDGAVEVEAAGEGPALEAFRGELAEGPPYARVQKVEQLPVGDVPLGRSFEIRH
jgi:acylphosphatase